VKTIQSDGQAKMAKK